MDNTAVLERPVDDSPPEFDESEWSRQMETAGGLKPESTQEESTTINAALGLPEDLEDLWPGHCYLAPSIKQVEKIVSLGNSAQEKFNGGDLFGSVNDGAELIQTLARRIEGDQLLPVTADEIKEEFDAESLGRVCHHILRQQGLAAENVRGNSPSGRSIGALNFHSSAAISQDIDSAMLESLLIPNSEPSSEL